MDTDTLDAIEHLVADFIDHLKLECDITAELGLDDEENSFVYVKLIGEDLSDLIGYHGKNIDSLQTLVNLAYNRKREKQVKVVIDINDYREKRESYLRSMAERAVMDVLESNQPMELPPMKPSERRIIHMVVKSKTGVLSRSDGEEPDRYVIIQPE